LLKSVSEYFQLDYADPYEKYEYLDGVVRLMSGESGEHIAEADQGSYEVLLHLEKLLKIE